MKRYLAVLVLIAFCTGCIALQRTPEATVLQSLRTIAVIPVESSGPWVPVPPSPPSGGGGGGCAGPGCGGLVAIVAAALVVYGVYRLADIAINRSPRPLGWPTVEQRPQHPNAMLTEDLAKTAAETLQRDEARNVYLVDGYLPLRRNDPPPSPADARAEAHKRILRWYNEDVTSTDYSALGLDGLDATLEVGIYLYEYDAQGSLATLGVMARLVDPATKQVLGRAKDWRSTLFRATKPALPGQRDKAVGRELVAQCLKDLGLVAE